MTTNNRPSPQISRGTVGVLPNKIAPSVLWTIRTDATVLASYEKMMMLISSSSSNSSSSSRIVRQSVCIHLCQIPGVGVVDPESKSCKTSDGSSTGLSRLLLLSSKLRVFHSLLQTRKSSLKLRNRNLQQVDGLSSA